MVFVLLLLEGFFKLLLTEKHKVGGVDIPLGSLIQQALIQGDGSKAAAVPIVLIEFSAALRGQMIVRMLGQIILPILNGPFSTNEQQRSIIVEGTHLVRGFQFPACGLIVGGIAAVPPFGLAVGVRIDGLLAQQLGNILVGSLLIAAKIEEFIMR